MGVLCKKLAPIIIRKPRHLKFIPRIVKSMAEGQGLERVLALSQSRLYTPASAQSIKQFNYKLKPGAGVFRLRKRIDLNIFKF